MNIRNMVGIANMFGNAYLKYVFAGDAKHTKSKTSDGIRYIISLYFFL